ncbi:MAG: hydroxymethylbilane synthase [Rickettsiales bacterium]
MRVSRLTTHHSPLTRLRIGTRASKLALAQAEMVRAALTAYAPDLHFEIVAMTTAGDRELHKTLADWGFKGLFTKELEDALLNRTIDFAVHSMKDMPSELPPGLSLAALLPRADVRDAWVSPHYATLADLPQGGIVGTSSARRAAQLKHRRPDVRLVPLRGNVQTRLRKLDESEASATFLAVAGLQRLGLEAHIRDYLAPEIMLPAAAQGAVGIECRSDNTVMRDLLAAINHHDTAICVAAERAMLLTLDGSCRTPIAGLAMREGTEIFLRGEVLSLDGSVRHHESLRGPVGDAPAIGLALGRILRERAGEELLRYV